MKRRLENPLLHYHLFGFTLNRVRRQPLLYGAVALAIGLTYLMVFQLVAYNEASVSSTLNLALFVMGLAAPLMSYNLFSLEYEKQTWESLALTRLTARQILWGKWGAALARVALLSLLALPLILQAIDLDIYISGSTVGRYITVFEPTRNLYAAVASLLILFGWGALVVSIGMWLSFKLKRTLSTASALYAGQVFVLALLPLLYSIFSLGAFPMEWVSSLQSPWEGLSWWIYSLVTGQAIITLNPFMVGSGLQEMMRSTTAWYDWHWGDPALFLSDYQRGLFYLGWGVAQSLMYLALAALFAGLTYRGLKYAWRK
ncbi:MAG: hypothetical protein NZM10_05260 [Fimbriimonadales bacterium]|nr:hypothetical protein [Fimbriimonadales bacterium]